MMLSLSFWLAALSCACLLAAGALFLFSRTPPSHVGARRPPLAPGCNWLMGHLLLMAPPDHHEPLRDLVDKTGPAFRVRLPAIGTVHILVEGAAVRHVLATFPKSPFYNWFDGATEGVKSTFTMSALDTSVTWRRKHVRGAFATSSLKTQVPTILSCVDVLCSQLDALPPGAVVDMAAKSTALALDILGEVALGGRKMHALAGGEPGALLLRALPETLDETVRKALFFWRRWLPACLVPGRSSALRMRTAANDAVRSVVAAGRAAPPGSLDGTILGGLLSLPLSEKEVVAETLLFVIAGHDTTANSVAWAIAALAAHPGAQAKVQAELDSMFGPPRRGESSKVITADAVAKCDFLFAVQNEAMRLNSVVAEGPFRICPEDTVIPGGWLIKKGEIVNVFVHGCNTGASFPGAFASPREFQPERWLPRGSAHPPPPQWLPFSAGTRDCVGQNLAVLQSRATLATLLHRFTFVQPPGAQPVRGRMSLTLTPDGGVPCIVTPRG